MPKSRKRGGEKAHRKRVQKTNSQKKAVFMKQQKIFQDAMMEQIDAMREKYSAETQNQETTDDAVGFVQSSENL